MFNVIISILTKEKQRTPTMFIKFKKKTKTLYLVMAEIKPELEGLWKSGGAPHNLP